MSDKLDRAIKENKKSSLKEFFDRAMASVGEAQINRIKQQEQEAAAVKAGIDKFYELGSRVESGIGTAFAEKEKRTKVRPEYMVVNPQDIREFARGFKQGEGTTTLAKEIEKMPIELYPNTTEGIQQFAEASPLEKAVRIGGTTLAETGKDLVKMGASFYTNPAQYATGKVGWGAATKALPEVFPVLKRPLESFFAGKKLGQLGTAVPKEDLAQAYETLGLKRNSSFQTVKERVRDIRRTNADLFQGTQKVNPTPAQVQWAKDINIAYSTIAKSVGQKGETTIPTILAKEAAKGIAKTQETTGPIATSILGKYATSGIPTTILEKLKAKEPVSAEEIAKYPELQRLHEDANQAVTDNAARQQALAQDVGNIAQTMGLKNKQHEQQKSSGSIVSKVLRNVEQNPNYTIADVKDLTRGSIVLDDINVQFPQAHKELISRGYAPSETFGKVGWGGYAQYHYDGPNGEIQIHTQPSWDYKMETSDPYYHDYRKWIKSDPKTIPKGFRKKMAEADVRSRAGWQKIYAGFDRDNILANSAFSTSMASGNNLNMATSSSLLGSTQAPSLSNLGGASSMQGSVSTTQPLGNLYTGILNPPSITSVAQQTMNVKDNLLAEAKKYKTAEEFVKEQDKYLYHNSLQRFFNDIKEQGLIVPQEGDYPHGVKEISDEIPRLYFAENKSRALEFGGLQNSKYPETSSLLLRVKQSAITGKTFKPKELSGGETWVFDNVPPIYIEYFDKNTDTWKPITGKLKSKTPSQLTSIWEQAQKGVDPTTKAVEQVITRMKSGEKGSAVIFTPEQGEKIRKFIETVKNSVATDPALAAIIDSRYTPKTNKMTLAEADTIINTDYNLAYAMAMEPGKPSALSNTIAIRLISQAQAVGNWEEAKRLVEMTAERNTAAGQAIQALSMYSKLAPEGVTSYVSSVVNRAALGLKGGKFEAFKKAIEGITDDEVKAEIAKKMGVPYLSTLMQEEIYNDAVRIQQMPDGREKTVATALMLKKIAMQIPSNLLKKVSMAQTLAQLINPKTVIRNIFGNFGFALAEELSMTMATGLDVMASLITKERTQGLPNLKAQLTGFYKGAKEGLQEALLGIDTRKLNTKFDIPRNGVFHKGVMGALQKTLAVILQAPDRAFFEAAYMDSLSNQMRINKSNDITPEMMEQATQDALYKTFQDNSVPAKFLTQMKKAFNLGKDWGMGDMVLKYPATPGNIWARGFEYSPAGFIKTAYHLGNLIRGYEKTRNQREFVRGFARAFTGSALYFGVAAALAGLGLISGKRDPDRDVSALKRSVGMKSYQINVSGLKRFIFSGMDPAVAQYEPGDILVSYDWALPISIPMVVGANVVEEGKRRAAKEVPEPGRAITEGIAEAANSMVDQPMLAGLARMRGANIADWLKSTLTGIPASFVPTASYQLAKLADNIVRNTEDPNFFRQAYNMVAAKVPGLSKTLPGALNTFGQPMKSYQGDSNNPFNVFLNPAFVTKYKPDPVSKMVLDIYQQTGETGHFPRVAPKSLTIDGKTIRLKPEQYRDYQQYIGNKTGVLYTILANDPYFMRLPDEIKANKLAGYLNDINTAAKIELFGLYPKKTVRGQRQPYVPRGAKNILDTQ